MTCLDYRARVGFEDTTPNTVIVEGGILLALAVSGRGSIRYGTI